MVQRSSPLSAVIRAYSAGGARALIDTIDDNKHMQEGNHCQGMRGEKWNRMEAPQNYGFTSVVADAMKDANGMIKDCAEGFISFMGGNRAFPVMGVMDDRRHRLMNLAQDAAKGAVAMFGLREWGQQFLNTEAGLFLTGNIEKKIRIALVKNKNGQQQQQAQTSEFATDGAGASGGQGQGQQNKGQKTLHKEDAETFIEMLGKQQQDAGTSATDGGGGNDDGVITIKAKNKIVLQVGDSQVTIDGSHINVIASMIHEVGKCYHGQSSANGTDGELDETTSDTPAKQVWNAT